MKLLTDVQDTRGCELTNTQSNEDPPENDESHHASIRSLHNRPGNNACRGTIEDTFATQVVINRCGYESTNELADIDDGCCQGKKRCSQSDSTFIISCRPVVVDEGSHALQASVVDLIVAIAECAKRRDCTEEDCPFVLPSVLKHDEKSVRVRENEANRTFLTFVATREEQYKYCSWQQGWLHSCHEVQSPDQAIHTQELALADYGGKPGMT